MKTRNTKAAKAVEMRITLMLNNCLTNDPCAICGARCDPGGLDYFDKQTGGLVCDPCAKKYAPEMVEIREAALSYAKREAELITDDIQYKIRNVINEPIEQRVMRVFDELNGGDVPF